MNKLQIKLYNNISNLFLLICLFPYISLINTPFDTQPYALAFSFLVLIVFFWRDIEVKIPVEIILMFIVFIYAILISIMRGTIESEYFIRSLVGYISLPSICLASYFTFNYVKGKVVVFSTVIWFFFGLIQWSLDKTFGSFLLPRLSTSEDRGVTALAVEPSAYAIVCIFLLVLNDLMVKNDEYSLKVYRIVFSLLVIQLLLSKAALGIVLFVVYILCKLLLRYKLISFIKYFILITIVTLITNYTFLSIENLRYSRLGTIIYKLNNNPENLVFTDGSISDRLSHILLSFSSLGKSNGIGFGLGSWDKSVGSVISSSGDFINQLVQVNFTLGRIMSGWGSMIFEVGIFGGMIILLYLFLSLKMVIYKNGSIHLESMIVVFFIMMTSVSLSFPLFGYMLGAFLAIYNDSKSIKEGITK